jgi:hypothetical protein
MAYTVNITAYEPNVVVSENQQVVTVGSTTTQVVLNTSPAVFGTVPTPGATGAQGATGPAGNNGTNGLSYGQLTSTSTNTISTATQTFTVNQASGTNAYAQGAFVWVKNASGSGGMTGGIVSYTGNTLVINPSQIFANGTTSSNWYINLSGQVGPTGATGAQGPQGATGPGVNFNQSLNTTDTVTFSSLNLTNTVNMSAYHVGGITGTTPIQIGGFNVSSYKVAKYLVHISDSGSWQVDEFILRSGGGDTSYTRYGELDNNGSLGSYSVQISGPAVFLTFTPTGATNLAVNSQVTYLA